MKKTDKYLKETIQEILESGSRDQNPRPKNSKGEPAHSRFITQKVFEYNVSKGHYPITTLRTTALRGAWEDINTIYLKQTNILEEMHPSIHSWWKDFCKKHNKDYNLRFFEENTTMEDEMLILGYDGLIIKGREMVNYSPDNIKYYKTENELHNYYERLRN
jgi:thymidylate synthase